MSTKKKAAGAKAKQRTSAKAGDSKAGSSGKKPTGSKPPDNLKPGSPARKGTTKVIAKTASSPKSGKVEKAIRKSAKDIAATIGSMGPPGSPERVAAGVAAVAVGALIAGATLGAGPAALAGAAGYLAYKGLSGPEKKKKGAGSATPKRATRKGSATRKRKAEASVPGTPTR
jgi:hypothetical protein